MYVYLIKDVLNENCVIVYKDVYLYGLKMDNEWFCYFGWNS